MEIISFQDVRLAHRLPGLKNHFRDIRRFPGILPDALRLSDLHLRLRLCSIFVGRISAAHPAGQAEAA